MAGFITKLIDALGRRHWREKQEAARLARETAMFEFWISTSTPKEGEFLASVELIRSPSFQRWRTTMNARNFSVTDIGEAQYDKRFHIVVIKRNY